MLLREGKRETGRQIRFLLTDKQNVSNVDVNVTCHFANLLESRPCPLSSSCPFMSHFRPCLSVSNI